MFVSSCTEVEYTTLDDVFKEYCRSRSCWECPFDKFLDKHPGIDDCNDVPRKFPDEAMEMMKVVEKDEKFEFDETAFRDLIGIGKLT